MTSPTDDDALAALRTLRSWWGNPTASPHYDADHLPPGVTSRDAFLRIHRAHVKTHPGWFRSGKTRSVSSDAWSAYVDRETAAAARPKLTLISAESEVGAVSRALGIRLTRGGR